MMFGNLRDGLREYKGLPLLEQAEWSDEAARSISQDGMPRLERLTVVQDGIFGLQHTKQITRLYVTQPQGE